MIKVPAVFAALAALVASEEWVGEPSVNKTMIFDAPLLAPREVSRIMLSAASKHAWVSVSPASVSLVATFIAW
jgi:hypothetical protein